MTTYSTYDNDGLVIDSITGKGRAGLRVEAHHDSASGALAVATTEEDGQFSMSLDDAAVAAAITPATLPDTVYFKVFEDSTEVLNTRGAIEWAIPQAITRTRLFLDTDYVVQVDGTVADAVTGPIDGVEVRLVGREVTSTGMVETLAVQTTTNADGEYRLRHAFSNGRPLSVLVRAHDASSGAMLAESPEQCRPAAKLTVDLTVGGERWAGPSELDQLDAALAREVAASQSLATMTDADARAMACVVGQDEERVSRLAKSEALAASTGVPREVFYGLGRGGLDVDLDVLSDVSKTTRQAALEQAIARGRMRLASGQTVATMMTSLSAALVTHAQTATSAPGRTAMKDVLDSSKVSVVDSAARTAFLTRYVDREEDDDAFWNLVVEDTGAATAAELKTSFQLATVLQGFVPLIAAVGTERGSGAYPTLADFAAIDRATLEGYVPTAGAPHDYPPHIEGETEADRRASYLDGVMAVLKRTFPSVAVRKAVDGSSSLAHGDTLLNSNKDFDIYRDDFDTYALEYGALSGADRETALAEAKTVQRVARLVEDQDDTKTLLEAGFYSAHQIASMSAADVTASLIAAGMAQGAIDKVVCAARAQSARTQMMSMAVRETRNSQFAAIRGGGTPSAATATWANLFGDVSFCSCEHCRSVYSPAAYFVDLMSMLDQGAVDANTNPIEMLLDRRPDLQHMQLSCANTNTLIPYIDLVNEALESYVVNQVVATPAADITMGDTGDATAEELRAAPQRVLHAAYDELAAATYPLSMPFVRPLEVARTYLPQMGLSRLDLVRSLRGAAGVDDDAVAAEQLGMSAGQFAIVGDATVSGAHVYYGFDTETGWDAALLSVSTFMARASASFEELSELIQLRVIQVVSAVSIESPNGDCDITEMTLSGATAAHFARMHRVLRLQRAVGWSLSDLGRILQAVNPDGDIDAATLRKVAVMDRYRAALNVPIRQLTALWGNIDTFGVDSVYDDVFMSRATLPTAVTDPFALNTLKTELDVASAVIADHVPAIAAALELDESDVRALIDQLPDAVLNLSNLSDLYGHALVARGFGLRVSDLLALLALTDGNASPFVDGDIAAAEDFLAFIEQVGRSGVSVPVLDYVYRHDVAEGRNPAPTDGRIDQMLLGLRAALIKVNDAFAPPRAYDLQAADSALSLLVGDPTQVVKMVNALNMDPGLEDPFFSGTLDATERGNRLDALLPKVDLSAEYSTMFAALAGGETAASRTADNVTTVMTAIGDYLKPKQQVEAVVAELSKSVGLDTTRVNALLTAHLEAVDTTGAPLVDEFVAVEQLTDESPVLDGPRSSFARFFKAAQLVQSMGISIDSMTALFAEVGGSANQFDLSTLPVAAPTTADVAASVVVWRSLADMMVLVGHITSDTVGLNTVLEATNLADAQRYTAAAAGWNLDSIEALTGVSGWNWIWANGDATKPEKLRQLTDAMNLAEPLSVDAGMMLGWAKAPTATQSENIVQALRARYDSERFLKVAQGLNDALRDTQREALVSFLVPQLADKGVSSANDLLSYLLIDVEMTSCMSTSRVKQAISSLQMFVQRVLFGLETTDQNDVAVSPTVIDVEQWEWRKSYRVWEANRKVFLYPENWIEPELRLDKSPFFRELEADLRKGELTDEAVEKALSDYLYKLDEVANLQVVAQLVNDGAGGDGAVHVIARTPSSPHQYFYRSRNAVDGWKAWERVDLEVQGEHCLLFEMHGRMYFAWAVLTEDVDQADNVSFEVNLFVSERRGTAWSTPMVSNEALSVLPTNVHQPPPRDFTLVADDSNGALVRCYRQCWVLDIGRDDYAKVYHQFWTAEFNKAEHQKGGFQWVKAVRAAYRDFREEWLADPANQSDSPSAFDINLPPELGATGFLNNQPSHLDLYNESPVFAAFLNRRTPHAYLEAQLANVAVVGDRYTWQEVGAFALDCGRVEVASNPSAPKNEPWASYGVPDNAWLSFQHGEVAAGVGRLSMDGGVVLRALPGGGQVTRPGDDVKASHNYYPFFIHCEGEQYFALPKGRWRPVTPLSDNVASTVLKDEDALQFGVGSIIDDAATKDVRSFAELRSNIRNTNGPRTRPPRRFQMERTYHPFVCGFIETLRKKGIEGLMKTAVQSLSLDKVNQVNVPGSYFEDRYTPTGRADLGRMHHTVAFGGADSYQVYNWELFFHIPLFIANRLNQEQRHAAAQRWFHFIFDPTTNDSETDASRFWQCRPLRDTDATTSVDQLVEAMADPSANPKLNADVNQQLAAWMANPFEPHRIAQVRRTAYMRTVVMKYVDNLIDWGDRLFRRDSIESINEAIQLYLLASNILGKRPIEVPPVVIPEATTYSALRSKLKFNGADDSAFGNALVAAENNGGAPFYSLPACDVTGRGRGALQSIGALAFCVPNNPNLLGYYGRVEDRLFKIRHCLNIDGLRRTLPLFEPPIDPALLVRARAAGIDIGTVLDELGQSKTPYRFAVLLSKAQQFTGEVRALGGALLAAIEKRDAETLSALRTTHEVAMLDAVRDIKVKQISEARSAIKSLRTAKQSTEQRLNFYRARTDGGIHLLEEERSQDEAIDIAQGFEQVGQGVRIVGSVLSVFPQIRVGLTGVDASQGGLHYANVADAVATGFQGLSTFYNHKANRAGVMAGRKRRHDDWLLQAEQTQKELQRIEQDLIAAEIREAIAQVDLENHDLQRKQSREVSDYLRDKFSSVELYDWMVSKLSEVYFQAYRLAFDMAKRAERAYRYELAIVDSNIITGGYWESLRQGLLAGEQLSLDLQRLDMAHITGDRREYELVKSVSLARLDPAQLLQLRHAGVAEFELLETLFDMDYPGQYMRRIKAVRLTLPVVAGPYTSVNCKLTQLKSSIRIEPDLQTEPQHRYGASEAVCTSSAQSDAGLFELSFQDPRYLPFEGTGAASKWRVELDAESNEFDLDTLTDAVIHISYMAREGGDVFKAAVKAAMPAEPTVQRVFSLRHEYPTAWNAFVNEVDANGEHVLTFSVAGRLPYVGGAGSLKAESVDVTHTAASALTLGVKMPGKVVFSVGGSLAPMLVSVPTSASSGVEDGDWTITTPDAGFDGAKVEDIFLVLEVKRTIGGGI